MIEIAGLAKRYGAVQVLADVSLSVRSGRITAIVGPNGSGKTTLLKILLGLVRPDAGTAAINGATVNGDWRYRSALGYGAQVARFPDNLTGREVLAMLGAVRGASDTDLALVAAFGLERYLDQRVHTLSTGMRQKLAVVTAFMFRAPLIILDEPTAGLDPVASGVLKARLRATRDEGRTVVFTSHVMAEVEELADDVAVLMDGGLRYAGPVDALRHQTGVATLEQAVAELMRA
ncbi:MAG: ABC transporter ATP-binding protein [Gemmatimonadales bacterium]